MRTSPRIAIRTTATACLALCAGGASGGSGQPVLRIEYATAAGSDGGVETGVVFWRKRPIQGAEVPEDLLPKFAERFPVLLKLDGKLANACYVTSAGFGLALLKRTESRLSGPLWFTADWAWTVDFALKPDGTVSGKMDSIALKGFYREVNDFSECYEKARSASSNDTPPDNSQEQARER